MGAPRRMVGDELTLRFRSQRLATGGAAAPAFRRVVEQLLDHGGTGFSARVLQEELRVARAVDPTLTPEGFIASVDPLSPIGWRVERLLGSASANLLWAREAPEFEDAVRTLYREFCSVPPPYDAGISYGAFRYVVPDAHIDLGASSLLVLPMNAPRLSRTTGLPIYPSWELGRGRANRGVAAVQASRVFREEIPLDQKGRALFETLYRGPEFEAYSHYLDPDLGQTRLQTMFTLSTGDSPIYRSAIQGDAGMLPGLREMPARSAEQARWELAARLERPDLIEASRKDLQAAWDATPVRGRDRRPVRSVPHDAYSRLSVDELYAAALRLRTAPKVLLNTFEWEHHRSQRFSRRMTSLVEAMGLGDEWTSRFNMLTGLCEPDNLHLLPPWKHAMEDLFAAGVSVGKVWDQSAFKTEAFRVNKARMDRYGNVLVATDFAKHPDLARAKDVLVAYEPRQLIELLSELRRDEVERAARRLRGADRGAWLMLADQLNRAADAYLLPTALRLPT